jgi:hypothetical protein
VIDARHGVVGQRIKTRLGIVVDYHLGDVGIRNEGRFDDAQLGAHFVDVRSEEGIVVGEECDDERIIDEGVLGLASACNLG